MLPANQVRRPAKDGRGRITVTALRTLLIGLIFLCPALAAAQDFPNKAIRMIVPFPPGGPNDIIARVVAQRMAEILKQPIILDNRSGQGGVVGTDVVAKAPPDGYTIAIASAGALAISPSMEKVAYDTLKDLQPITLVAKVPEMLVVATSVPANNMKELVELAKAQPGKLNFASSGPGSMPHLAGELLRLTAGINIVHVPYRGAAPAVNDLLAQQVQMVFLDPAGAAAADQGRQAQADCRRHHAAGGECTRCADNRGSRYGQLANRKLVRHGRAGKNATADRCRAQQGGGRSHERSNCRRK